MNDNPEGTPNPLNPAPEAAAPAPAPAPAPQPVAAEPAPAPAAPAAPAAAVPAAPAKKGKGGLIAAIICGIIALGCGVAALLFFFVFNKSGDPMTDAMVKLLNGDNRNVAISGSTDFDVSGSTVSINFNGQFDTTAQAGSVKAGVAGSFSGMDLNIGIEAKTAGDGAAYLQISGIKDIFDNALKQSGIDCAAVDCTSYYELMSGSTTSGLASLINLDGKWIKLTNSDIMNNIPFTLPGGVSVTDYNSNKNQIVELYRKYPFVTSSTDDLKISKKTNTLYKLGFDYDKMASFINEFSDSSSKVSASDLKSVYGQSGDSYVEIDGNKNITRLYTTLSANGTSKDIDLTISYPDSISIDAPTDALDSSALTPIFEMFSSYFTLFTGGNNYSYDYDYDYTEDDVDEDYDWTITDDDADADSVYDWLLEE